MGVVGTKVGVEPVGSDAGFEPDALTLLTYFITLPSGAQFTDYAFADGLTGEGCSCCAECDTDTCVTCQVEQLSDLVDTARAHYGFGRYSEIRGVACVDFPPKVA